VHLNFRGREEEEEGIQHEEVSSMQWKITKEGEERKQ
jgi:hypothetical protein